MLLAADGRRIQQVRPTPYPIRISHLTPSPHSHTHLLTRFITHILSTLTHYIHMRTYRRLVRLLQI